MDETKFIEIIATIIQRDASSVTMSTPLESVGWDSLSVLDLMAKIDELLGKEIDADRLTKAETVSDLYALVIT